MDDVDWPLAMHTKAIKYHQKNFGCMDSSSNESTGGIFMGFVLRVLLNTETLDTARAGLQRFRGGIPTSFSE
jgi:hypothetical protein